ncbi:MAG: exodeoxyribonuclease VII large subunit [Gammaproteobacteria bacterium]|nr:exodeoxyribonuclease VII large subunit [Pseudomonadales bacterium]MCP5346629.1 exodeoxyribonuclease VII large subunit [Pseudomonadales bacterium]
MALFSEPSPVSDSITTPTRPAVLSVSSLNHMARSLLEGHFPAVLVEGEISNFSTPSSGHWYLTLKDEKSQLRCAMFRNSNSRVRFRPANGNNVLVKGRISLYEARGDYQLIIDEMEEAGDGLLRRAFEQLKAKLSAQGLFDEQRKQPVHDRYRHVGVITSPHGAAIRDILTVFRRRFPAIRITVLPVAVQGKEAAPLIVQALERANRLAAELGIEVLLIARGGGSLEDLQPFNEEAVALAIAASELPVVCGVGHEIDFSIADFVADLRAPTPSAAAELLSPDQQEVRRQLLSRRQRLMQLIERHLQQQNQRIDWLGKRLKHPGKRLRDHAQTLDLLESRLQRALRWQLQKRQNKLRELTRTLLSSSPQQRLISLKAMQSNLQVRFRQAMNNTLRMRRGNLTQLVRNLNAVSPLSTLARGFSITYLDERTVVRSTALLKPGQRIRTRLHQGELESEVIRILPESGKPE